MRRYQARINQQHSNFRILGIPIASVILGSMTPLLPIISSVPITPPFGLMLLLGWRVLRPGIWPIWAGVPFGIIDDLFSGQPLGSAVLLWSVILISMDMIDERRIWRNFWQDWAIVGLMLIFAIICGMIINNLLPYAIENHRPRNVAWWVIGPQTILTLSLYPVIVALIFKLDRMRFRQ